MKEFEYTIEDELGLEDLNTLGIEGWELVSIVHTSWEGQRKGETHSNEEFYFKRETK